MLEDEIYRSSSQYRLWSFTAASLRETREKTNASASVRTKAAIQRKREAAAQAREKAATPDQSTGTGTATPQTPSQSDAPSARIECLTVDEELELTNYYCVKIMHLGDLYNPPLPTQVLATAIQYLRRFYLSNSPMIYHPRDIMPCCLYLATKTENYSLMLPAFTEKLSMTQDAVIAPEFLLTQALRFTFDIRHPFRGLEGALAELTAMSRGEAISGPHFADTALDLKAAIHALPPQPQPQPVSTDPAAPPPPPPPPPPPATLFERFARVHRASRDILKTAAQCTDVYFLYTPSQIWLAALSLVDQPLADFYLDTKMGTAPHSRPKKQQHQQQKSNNSSSTGTGSGNKRNNSNSTSTADSNAEEADIDPQARILAQLRDKVGAVIRACAGMMQAYRQAHAQETAAAREKSIKAIGKKLYYCQNPEKSDLIALNKRNRAGQSSSSASSSLA